MEKVERLYFIIKRSNGLIKYYDSHLDIMMGTDEFLALYKNGYFDKFNLVFANYSEH